MSDEIRGSPQWTAWKLYWSMFRDGENVIIIKADESIHYGKLTTYEGYCVLGRL